MTFSVLFVLAILGALVYSFAGKSEAKELGRIVFFCAMLWLAHEISSGRLRL